MKKSDSMKYWLIANIIFSVSYALSLLPLIIKIPQIIPPFLVTIFLIISYALTLQKFVSNPKQLLQNSNFYCVLIFLTFPKKFLLFPFFLVSITNISSFVVLHKKKYGNSRFYSFAADFVCYQKEVYLFAYVCEVLCVIISFFMSTIGRSSFLTFLSYFYCVYNEYKSNAVMRKALKKIRDFTDIGFERIHYGNEYYKKTRDYIGRKYGIKEEIKKE